MRRPERLSPPNWYFSQTTKLMRYQMSSNEAPAFPRSPDFRIWKRAWAVSGYAIYGIYRNGKLELIRMKRLALLIAIIVVNVACSSVTPDAGFEAVLIRKPMFVGHGGVDETAIKTGRTYVAWTTDAQYVDLKPQRVDMEFDDLMTASGVPIDFHAVFSYQITNSVQLVSRFGNDYIGNNDGKPGGEIPGWFLRNLDQPFRTAVRDAVKKRDMQAMAITAAAAEEVDAEVTKHLEALIKETGVPVKLIDLSLGRANPPDSVKHQRIETATQEQRIITEQQRKLAEDQRKLAEESRAAADAAYNLRMNAAGGANLPPALSLQLKEIEMKREVCARANCTFWFGEQPLVTAQAK
jgi:regulator of protease activity HflC (stomatin/prohibitin superfamily)